METAFLKEYLFLSVLQTHSKFRENLQQEILQSYLGLATHTHAQKKQEKKKRQLLPSEKQAFFPLVSCLWMCTALEKCIINFYTWNCLRKLEILVQRNQFVEMPMWVLYIHKEKLEDPCLQLLMYISIVGLQLLQAWVTLSITNNIITMLKILIQNSFRWLFPKNILPFKIELCLIPSFSFECFSFKKGFFKKILAFKTSLKIYKWQIFLWVLHKYNSKVYLPGKQNYKLQKVQIKNIICDT